MFKEKISIFQQILGALFPFRAEYGFPVVVHGIQDGNVRTRGNPVSVHGKSTRYMVYHFFLAMVLRGSSAMMRYILWF